MCPLFDLKNKNRTAQKWGHSTAQNLYFLSLRKPPHNSFVLSTRVMKSQQYPPIFSTLVAVVAPVRSYARSGGKLFIRANKEGWKKKAPSTSEKRENFLEKRRLFKLRTSPKR